MQHGWGSLPNAVFYSEDLEVKWQEFSNEEDIRGKEVILFQNKHASEYKSVEEYSFSLGLDDLWCIFYRRCLKQ